LEQAVRKLDSAALTAPVGSKHQYSTINYSVLGLIVQTVAGQSYERYVQTSIFDPLQCGTRTRPGRRPAQGLATGHNYLVRPTEGSRPAVQPGPRRRATSSPALRTLTHYLISQLNGGRYEAHASSRPAWNRPASTVRPLQTRRQRVVRHGLVSSALSTTSRDPPSRRDVQHHANVVLIPQSRGESSS
jgi:CubicO group peptidase (beta-lactamase class C family)